MTESQIAARPYSLLRAFSIFSLLSIVVIGAVSAALLSRFLSENLMQRDAVVTMEFVQSIAQAQNAKAYFVEKDYSKSAEALETLFDQIAHMPDVVLAHVYSKDGTIIWSKFPELIGTAHGDNPELGRALAGELVLETSNAEDTEKFEHGLLPSEVHEFIENYIPVHDGETGMVVGVVEVYKAPKVLIGTIRRAHLLVWVSAAGGSLFLYVTLFWIVRRASTVIRRQQAALVDSERMAAVGEMVAAVAHGVRNPLASIRSSAELALDTTAGPAQENLHDIMREVDRLGAWVRDLLTRDHSALRHGDVFSVTGVIRRCLEGFEARFEQQDIRLGLDLDDSLPAIRGDGKLLGQAIDCLISNALEAMPDGGRLSVSARHDGASIQIRVRDTGFGIPADKLADVGKPFVTHKPNGLGVGLSLVHRILKRFDGTLSLSSLSGHGTTAHLTLPVRA